MRSVNSPITDSHQALAALRRRAGLSVRKLAELSDVSAGMISFMERGRTSPSLVTLQKVLHALGTDLGTFFAGGSQDQSGPVYPRERMKSAQDAHRSYAFVFPRRDDIALQMMDETLRPGRKPEFETLACDVGGYVLAGTLRLEIGGEPPRDLRPGDGFYVNKGRKHRGYAIGKEPVRLISVQSPPNY